MDIKAPTEFCKPSVTIVEDRHYKDSSHEVYFVYKKGTPELFYVGCESKEESLSTFEKVSRDFKPGDVYTAAYIKEYLQSLGMTNAYRQPY